MFSEIIDFRLLNNRVSIVFIAKYVTNNLDIEESALKLWLFICEFYNCYSSTRALAFLSEMPK